MWVPVLFAAAMASGLTGLLYMLLKKKTDQTEQRLRSQLVENIRQIVQTTLPIIGGTGLDAERMTPKNAPNWPPDCCTPDFTAPAP